jgi:hypothetical protein
MVYFLIKFKHILIKYAYMYICMLFVRYIYKIKAFTALNITKNYLNLFFNLFIFIMINMYFFVVLFNLYELYKLGDMIKNYILNCVIILFVLNKITFKLIFNVLLVKAIVLNYFFYLFWNLSNGNGIAI